MLAHVLEVAGELGAARKVVVDRCRRRAGGRTGAGMGCRNGGAGPAARHRARGAARPKVLLRDFEGNLLVLFGDTPLITAEALAPLLDQAGRGRRYRGARLPAEDPTGYGRMVTDGEWVTRVVEHKDASDHERATATLCFAGMLAGQAGLVFDLLRGVGKRERAGRILSDRHFRLRAHSAG